MLDLTDWQNKKYTTRDGKPVRILCVDAKGKQPIIGLFTQGNYENMARWCIDGNYDLDNPRYVNRDTHMDLINAKKKREGWVNIAKIEGFVNEARDYVTSGVYSSKEEADKHHFNVGWNVDCIACVRIEWEE